MKTIYELWNELISRKQVGTARSYQDAFARFRKDNGLGVNFVEITPGFVDNWRRRMQCTLSKTTINIYLRAFSAILHLAYEYQFISIPPKFLFRGLGIFSKNASNSRKHCYLPAADWIKMWDFFKSCGAESIAFSKCRKDLQRKYLEALGLMLFMYLGNGMNLRDVCMLRYTKHYFQTGGKQLQFKRHKTAERIESTIEIPILPQIQRIIDRLGSPPKEGGLVFPYLEKVIGGDWLENKQTALLGHAIRDRMKAIAKFLLLPVVPTPTWARHSFATNLTHAGVPKDYISWAMGHTNNSVTNNYIASYCYEQMVDYNSLLLYPAQTVEHILSQVNALSQEEKEKLMQELLRQNEKI